MKTMISILVFLTLVAGISFAAEQWEQDFQRLCGYTSTAHEMSDTELSQAIRESEGLLEELTDMQQDGMRVYIFRLKKCIAYFRYTLDARASSQ